MQKPIHIATAALGRPEPSEALFNWALEYDTLILFFLKGTLMKQKFIRFSPWLLKSPVKPSIADLEILRALDLFRPGEQKPQSFFYRVCSFFQK